MHKEIMVALLYLLITKPPHYLSATTNQQYLIVSATASTIVIEKDAFLVKQTPHIIKVGISHATEVENAQKVVRVQVKAIIPAHNAPRAIVKTQVSIPSSTVQDVIRRWARSYGVDENKLLRISLCESGYSQYVVNHKETPGNSPSGIFQFKPQTFFSNAKRAGIVNADLWSIDDQAHTAAYMFSIHQDGQWQCK